MIISTRIKAFLYIFALVASPAAIYAQNPSQLAFSQLRANASALVEEGQLVEALPLLKEFVKRVQATADNEIKLDYSYFLIGTAHIQLFVTSGDKDELSETLKWYERLEKDYPGSSHMKEMVLKRIDVLRALQKNDEAAALMIQILEGKYQIDLNNSERINTLKGLNDIFYGTGNFEEGLPYFAQLLQVTNDPEDQALAAAAGFEGLFEADRIDEAIGLLPYLARETAVRYRPRLNVALLKASDRLVEKDRTNDAALVLNLIKTTDLMIEYHRELIRQKRIMIDQRTAFNNALDTVEQLEREVESIEANLEKLEDLPTLRSELFVRRARNYTATERGYEAFWMFFDLMKENPEDPQIEFFYYATFSNALQLEKWDILMETGKSYLEKFPEGDYFADISGGLVQTYRNLGENEKFIALTTSFIENYPFEPVAASIFAQWASFMIERELYDELIAQSAAWATAIEKPAYEDGIFYWSGLAKLQLNQFADAAESFEEVVSRFPNSAYSEDSLLRQGVSLFYAQSYMPAFNTLKQFVDQYPNGQSLDQAYLFLGELANFSGDLEAALNYFQRSDSLTSTQGIHDAVAFRIGTIYEALERYETMVRHFEYYIERFGESGNMTRAIFEIGRAYEFQMRPVQMLSLYRKNILKYAVDAQNAGVDILIEGYAEKYAENLSMLKATVEMFDRLENEPEFLEKFVTDRGFLFEQFYYNRQIYQPLYMDMRKDPAFGKDLIDDPSPLKAYMDPFRRQLSQYPESTPEDFFREGLAEAREANDPVFEIRMLMGLYRIGVELDPSEPFDEALVSLLSPLATLYVADYERDKRLDFAVAAWRRILFEFPGDDSNIVAYMRLASVSAEEGNFDEALDFLEQIVSLFPSSPKVPAVILRQGELLTEIGRGEEAREKYQYILRVPEWRGPLHARALLQIGDSFMAEEAFAKAHGFYERTFLGYPHLAEWSARAYLADARALLGMGAREDAIRTLEEGVREMAKTAPEELMTEIESKLQELKS